MLIKTFYPDPNISRATQKNKPARLKSRLNFRNQAPRTYTTSLKNLASALIFVKKVPKAPKYVKP